MKRPAVLLAALLLGCSGTEPPGTVCPEGAPGPALDPLVAHAVVVGSLAETWSAHSLVGEELGPSLGFGLAGRAPNHVAVTGEHLYLVNSLDNSIQKVDRATGVTLECLPLGAGTNPWALAVDPEAGRGWVTTFLSGEVIEIDLADLGERRRVTVGTGLEGIHLDADDVIVTLTGFGGSEGVFGQGYVVLLDRATLAERRRLPVPTNPQDVFVAGGRVHVVCTGNYGNPPPAEPGRLVRLSPDRTAVSDTLLLGGSPVEAAVTDDGRAFLAGVSGGLRVVDTATFTPAETGLPPEFAAPGWSGVDALGNLVLAVNFDLDAAVLFDAGANALAGSRLTGDGPVAVVFAPATVAPAAPTP